MSVSVHLTQIFSTSSPDVFDECDAIMDELTRREESDPTVRDSTVSADRATGLIAIEVYADGIDGDDARQAALARILAAVETVVRLEVLDDDAAAAPVIKSRETLVSEAVPA